MTAELIPGPLRPLTSVICIEIFTLVTVKRSVAGAKPISKAGR